MPAAQNDIIEATVIHDNDISGEQVNRYQFRYLSAPSLPNFTLIEDLASFLETAYNLIVTVVSIRNVLRELRVFNVTQDLLLGSTDLGTYEGGTAADPAAPQGVSPYIYFKTPVPRVILSKYLPSTSDAQTATSGRLDVSATADVVAYGAAMLSEWSRGGRDYEYGYFSPKTVSWIKPTLAVVTNILAYQRRRKEGRGS